MAEIEETTDFTASRIPVLTFATTLAETCEFVYMLHMFARAFAKTSTLIAAIIAAGVLLPGVAQASELLMFDQAGCVYCARWDRDVGSLYEKTPESKSLPLRRIDIQNQKASGVALASPVRYTPTFVVVDNGREVGRITGYSNDDSFWGLLEALAAKLAPPAHDPNRI